jgi:hypothetical protein
MGIQQRWLGGGGTMTIQDFIVAYNATFKYLEDKYGTDAERDLWKTISDRWCTHLRQLVKEKGLDGMLEYWGGTSGTLSREKAGYEVFIKDGAFHGIMIKCPSVGELEERGYVPHHGKVSYCDHCLALYGPIANDYGFDMGWQIDYRENGLCKGSCQWWSQPKPGKEQAKP